MFELDSLQYLMTASGGEITQRAVEMCLAELGAAPPLNSSFSPSLEVIQALENLGHCEVTGVGARARIAAAAPALAVLPTFGPHRAVLAGTRAPSTIEALNDACRHVNRDLSVASSTTLIPSGWARAEVIIVQSPMLSEIEAVAALLGINISKQPAAWEILLSSASVAMLLSSAFWQEGFSVPHDAVYFNCNTFRFADNYEGGLQLARWHASQTGAVQYALRLDRRLSFIDGPEWGRHIQISSAGFSSLRYDFSKRIMAHRGTVRLPRLITRALVLCSGYLPKIEQEDAGGRTENYLLYEQVPLPIAELVAEKLGQELIPSKWR